MAGEHLGTPGLLPGGSRLVKTHEPHYKVYGRAIYLVRDVRDVAISFRKLRTKGGYREESFEDFLIRFASGDVGGYVSWQKHVASWLTAINAGPGILLVRYEDLVSDTVTKLGDMAKFLGVPVNESRLCEITQNNPVGKVRDDKDQFYDQRILATPNGNPKDRWREHYTPSELALLEPAMQVMRQAGYVVEED